MCKLSSPEANYKVGMSKKKETTIIITVAA